MDVNLKIQAILEAMRKHQEKIKSGELIPMGFLMEETWGGNRGVEWEEEDPPSSAPKTAPSSAQA